MVVWPFFRGCGNQSISALTNHVATMFSLKVPGRVPSNVEPPDLLLNCFHLVWECMWEEAQIVACGGWSLERPGYGEVVQGLGHLCHFAVHPDCMGKARSRGPVSRICLATDELGGLHGVKASGFVTPLPSGRIYHRKP